MKLEFIVLLAVLGSGLVAVSFAESTNGDAPVGAPKTGVQSSFRAKFVMPKLFDFQAYTERFSKHYPNAAELVRRSKIYMARAFAVFISAVKYWRRKATKYLKVNQFTDWTVREIEAIENPMLVPQSRKEESKDGDSKPTPAVDAEDIERVLADIVEHKDENPEFAAIAAELQGGQKRKRRSLDARPKDKMQQQRRHLSMDELMGGREEPKVVSPKYKSHVPSNNPDHEPLQVFSEGADDLEAGEKVKPIDHEDAKRIDDGSNDGGYLSLLMNSFRSTSGVMLGSFTGEELEPVPDEVYLDYRTTGCFVQPKSQVRCGACYIFATVSLMEYQYCIQTGNLISFSEQHAVDCGPSLNYKLFNGCHGGQPYIVMGFLAKYGLELASDYPYRAKEQTCPMPADVDPTHMGHVRFEEPESWWTLDSRLLTPVKIRRVLQQYGPAVIGIKTNAEFSQYGGGVDTLKCDPSKKKGHAMVLIGDGIEDGIEYWLIRNSQGTYFGLQGHYKLAKSYDPECMLSITYMTGQFRQNQDHQGKAIFYEIKKQNLLAHFGITADSLDRSSQESPNP